MTKHRREIIERDIAERERAGELTRDGRPCPGTCIEQANEVERLRELARAQQKEIGELLEERRNRETRQATAIGEARDETRAAEADVKCLREGIEEWAASLDENVSRANPHDREMETPIEVARALSEKLRGLLRAVTEQSQVCYCDPGAQCRPCAARDMKRLGKDGAS